MIIIDNKNNTGECADMLMVSWNLGRAMYKLSGTDFSNSFVIGGSLH